MYRKTPTYKQYTYAQRVTQQQDSQAFPTNLVFSSYVDTRRHPIFCCKNISFPACIGVILDRLIWAYWVAFALGWSPSIFFLVGRSRFIANPRHRSMDGEWRSEIRKEHFCHRSLQYLSGAEVSVDMRGHMENVRVDLHACTYVFALCPFHIIH